ncbi:hypothetical protein RB594_004937 [Gaeumannomyces avenae]
MFRSKKLDLGCTIKTRVVRDHTKRKIFEQFEPERQALRYIIRNTTLPPRMRAEAQLQLTQMHAYTRPTQIRNRCILGGKTRGVLRDFKLTRVRRATPCHCGEHGGLWQVPRGSGVLICYFLARTVQLQVTSPRGTYSRRQEGQLVEGGESLVLW